MAGIEDRVTRLEGRMEAQATKLSEVAEKVQWIKGYLETNGNGASTPGRDVGMVVGGGTGAGGLLFVLEKLFGG